MVYPKVHAYFLSNACLISRLFFYFQSTNSWESPPGSWLRHQGQRRSLEPSLPRKTSQARRNQASFEGWHFEVSDFEELHFERSCFEGSKLEESHFERSGFEGSNCEKSHFEGSVFKGSVFKGSGFGGSYFEVSSFNQKISFQERGRRLGEKKWGKLFFYNQLFLVGMLILILCKYSMCSYSYRKPQPISWKSSSARTQSWPIRWNRSRSSSTVRPSRSATSTTNSRKQKKSWSGRFYGDFCSNL